MNSMQNNQEQPIKNNEAYHNNPDVLFVHYKKEKYLLVHEHFKKLGALFEGGMGWWIKIEHKDTVEKICNTANMLITQTKLSSPSWEDFRRDHIKNFLTLKASDIEDDIKKYEEEKNVEKLNEAVSKWEVTKKSLERFNVIPATETSMPDESFDYLFENNTEEKLREGLKNISPDIETGYTIGGLDLAFPGAALSIIAAPTSHGKTTALINFSLGIIEKNHDKSVYFFTYEERAESIQIAFINTWISNKLHNNGIQETLSANNKRSISSYYRDSEEFIAYNMKELFLTYKNQFFEEIINKGRMRILYADMKVDKLICAIKCIKKRDDNVGAIVIDYMQLLTASNPRTNRQEELKQQDFR